MGAKIKTKVAASVVHHKGLFADQEIKKGIRVIKYTGELITNAEAERREKINDQTGVTYILYVDETCSIDVAVGGNDFRFVNHSCTPSCVIEIVGTRAYLVAKRNIKDGEELTFDYAFDKNDIKVPCHCGSKKCRGFINEV